ncbi:hypothetical protein [Phyllobacterium chamaecytisi]|uniref:hypothetical protein n=1 Tax=Phyllobacterium chamaecytisi TaxID=2876082 RepID=UPI001CC91ECC|nr:hypothetical protein [Phyllobacterium sp. KW56]MBZ9605702.1 hypothetical protein [Phyllobacterium sp. KW56]
MFQDLPRGEWTISIQCQLHLRIAGNEGGRWHLDVEVDQMNADDETVLQSI